MKKIQNDDHDNMVKHFSKLEVDNLNLQLKYQHLEERVKYQRQRHLLMFLNLIHILNWQKGMKKFKLTQTRFGN